MKINTPTLLFILVLPIASLMAQNKGEELPLNPAFKHSIGFQANPYIYDHIVHDIVSLDLSRLFLVSSLRYLQALEKTPRLRLGAEAYLIPSKSDIFTAYQLSIGPLIRYDIVSLQRLTFGAEFSPALNYSNIKFRNLDEQQKQYYNDISEFRFVYYIAPVINLRSKNARWSYDFSWKFSGRRMLLGKKNVPSFKIYYRF